MSAAPLVFLHGAMTDSAVWAEEAERLGAEGHPVLNLDLPGHGGRTDPPPDPLTLSAMAADLRPRIEEFAAEPPILIGWSLGAAVAMTLAIETRLPRGLILVGAAPQAVGDERFPEGLPPAAARQRDQGLGAAYAATARLFARQCAPEDEAAQARIGEMALRQRQATAQAVFAAAWHDALTDHLSSIGVPAFLIHGEADRVCPLAGAALIARHLPDRRGFEILPGAGHAPMLSARPAFREALAKALSAL